MSATPSLPTPDSSRSISESRPSVHTTSTLLRMAMSNPARPVDELIARLESPDGTAWLSVTLTHAARTAAPAMAFDSIADLLCDGGADAAQLEAIKDHGKRLLKSASTSDERRAGLAAYFFSIASALRHHGTLIGAKRAHGDGGPRDELHDALLDLAAATEHPWTAMLGEAALRTRGA